VLNFDLTDGAALVIVSAALCVCVVLWRNDRRRAALILWTGALIAVTVPFFDLHLHTHWAKVGWIPFRTPPIKASDLAANVALYVPFGFLFSRPSGHGPFTGAISCAAVLSVAVVFTQLCSHSRIPSTTDVVCNVIGAAVGVALLGVLSTWPASAASAGNRLQRQPRVKSECTPDARLRKIFKPDAGMGIPWRMK